MNIGKLSPASFAVRWVCAFVLVAGTYNTSSVNLLTWLSDEETAGDMIPFKIIVVMLFALGYVIYLRATFQSIGRVGIVMALVTFGAIFWLLSDMGAMNFMDVDVVVWTSIFVMSTIMTIGLSWSFIRRILSGQIDGSGVGS